MKGLYVVQSTCAIMTTPLPTQWSQAKRKSGPATVAGSKRARVRSSGLVQTTTDVRNIISEYEKKAPETVADELRMYVDQVVDSEPFESVLMNESADSKESIPVVTRQYEEQYMRECISKSEAACAMGDQCECMFIDVSEPFVGTVFVLPTLNDMNNLCVLCLRKTTHLLFYHMLQKGVPMKGMIQIYGNICNQKNEYHPSAMLICPPCGPVHCMPLPIVAHQRNRYTVVKRNDIRYLEQHCVGMQDFCQAPSNLTISN